MTTSYIIVKTSRTPDRPYRGPTCRKAGVPQGKIYTDLSEAVADANKLRSVNPVGFYIYNFDTGETLDD